MVFSSGLIGSGRRRCFHVPGSQQFRLIPALFVLYAAMWAKAWFCWKKQNKPRIRDLQTRLIE